MNSFLNVVENATAMHELPPQPSTSHSPPQLPSVLPNEIQKIAQNSVLASTTGELAQPDNSRPNHTLSIHSFNEPIGPHVSLDLKNQIWEHKSVDMAHLLPSSLRQKQPPHLTTKQPKLEIYNIDQWTSAFIFYVAIYAERYPSDTPGLMKHMEIVRDLGSRGGQAWRIYDDNFRTYRSNDPTRLKWGDFLGETWNRAVQDGNHNRQKWAKFQNIPHTQGNFRNIDGAQTQSNFRSNISQVPKSCCFGFCSCQQNCKFEHICGLCKKGHPIIHCQIKKRFSNPGNFSFTTQSKQYNPVQKRQFSRNFGNCTPR